MNKTYIIFINDKNINYFLNLEYNEKDKYFFFGNYEHQKILEMKISIENCQYFIKYENEFKNIINKIEAKELIFYNQGNVEEILDDNNYCISYLQAKRTPLENKLNLLFTINSENINYIITKKEIIEQIEFSSLYELAIELAKKFEGKIVTILDNNYSSFISIKTQGEMINQFKNHISNYIDTNENNYKELIDLIDKYNNDRNYALSAYIFKLLYTKYTNKQDELCAKYKIDMSQIKKVDLNKKNIFFYSNDWFHGGIERVLSIILPELTDDYNTILCYPSNHEKNGFKLEKDVIIVKNYYDYNVMFSVLALNLILNVNIFIGNPSILVDYVYIFEYLKCFNINSIAINHYYYFLPYMQEHLNIMIKERHNIFTNADVVAWLTEFNLCAYSHLYSNGILLNNPTNYIINEKKSENGKTIVSVGRFQDPIKRIDKILKVFNEARKIDSDLKLLIVGNYELGYQLKEYNNITIEDFKNTSFNNNIEWYGETDQISEIYKSSDLILMTSECEGLPLTLIEGITHALPIAMFKINGMEGIVENNFNGIVTAQDNYEELGKGIAELLNNKEKYKLYSNNSIKKAKKYQKESVVTEYKKIINALLENKKVNIDSQEILKKYDHDVIKEYENNINYFISNLDLTPKLIINETRIKRGIKYLKKNGIIKTIRKIKSKIFK